MKKKLIKCCASLFCAALVIIGCSKDEDSIPIETSKNINLKSGGSIVEFNSLLKNTYGQGNYSVDKKSLKVVDGKDEFFVYKVSIDKSTEGYILETPNDGNFYYEHDIKNKEVTEYNYDSIGKLNMSLIDMSGNEYYNLHGFTPIVPDDPKITFRRFWGWEISYGECAPCALGSCASVHATHYIFGIGGEEKVVMQFTENGSGGKRPASVDCVNGVPGIYGGDIMIL